jgi:large subunit ribosomal protein L15
MKLHELQPAPGATHARKRVGRGNGSGHGSFSGRGCKGQKARAGKPVRLGFEGGQLPLFRRLPHKRGFSNADFRLAYDVVNLGALEGFEAGVEVSPELLIGMGLVKGDKPIKILASGELTKALRVSADKFSASAKAKIEAAGGTVTEIPWEED